MNVYDFDETIYKGDSTRDFYFHCLKKHKSILKYLPYQGFAFLKFVLGIIPKTKFKEKFYIFLKGIKDIDKEINDFWEIHISNIKQWYLETKREDDLIISASPEFLLEPVSKKLGFSLMASRVDKYSGKTDGENCYGEEKVKRFNEKYAERKIEKFFSDSLSDSPLAEISEQGYIVLGNEIIPWEEYKPSKKKQFIKAFLSKEFIMFLAIGCINTINGVLFAMLFSVLTDITYLSFAMGYGISLLISYLLNSAVVFKSRLSVSKLIKFIISYIPNYLVQSICVILLGNLLNLPRLFVFLLSALIGVPVTFLLLKIFAFAKKRRNKMNLTEIIKGRRTIRKFTQEEIKYEVLKEFVDMARYAAYPANIQPLKYIIINDKKTVDEIFVNTKWAGYLEDGTPKENERPTAFVAVLGDTSLKKSFEVDAGAAITNMILSAYEKGIGTCWIGAFDKANVRKVLSLDEKYELVYLVAFGYPAQKSHTCEVCDGDIKYYLDENNELCVPKRSLEEVLL